MHVYIIGTLLSALFAFFSQKCKKEERSLQNRKIYLTTRKIYTSFFIVLSVIPLTVISAVRYGVGTDFFSYQRIYKIFRFDISNLEIGDKSLIFLLHKISDNPQIFFVVTSLWICIGYYISIYKNSIDPAYSIFIFVLGQEYFRSMNSIRQYMAAVIVMQAIPAVKEGKLKKVLIYTAIGMLFHMSAFMIIPLYILCRLRLKPMQLLLISAVFLLFINNVKQLAIRLAHMLGRYAWYFESSFSEGNFNPLVVAIYFSFLVFCEYLYGLQKVRTNDTINIVSNAAFIGMALFLSRLVLPRNVTRLAYYMDPVLILYTPELLGMIKGRKTRFVVKSIVFICYLFVFLLAPNSNNNQLPYQTFFS